jgi:hypothetical protein
MSSTTLRVHGVFDTGVTFRLTAEPRDADLAAFAGRATMTVNAGAFGAQTYITPAECEELASMLMLAAKELRDMEPLKVAA